MIWLVKGLRPSYKSIADFRKDHMAQLGKVNRDFVLLCKELGLFDGEDVAVDGSFFRGQEYLATGSLKPPEVTATIKNNRRILRKVSIKR